MQLNIVSLRNLLDDSFKEDYGTIGDITSEAVIPEDAIVNFIITARQSIVLCGIDVAKYYLDQYSNAKYKIHFKDSENVPKSGIIISGTVLAKEILLIERIMLNYLQHLSAIATLTNLYVKSVEGTKTKICDTRKTTPMLRQLEKYAVKCGGGFNHRLTMDSAILIKDNHIAICKTVKNAVELAKKHQPHYTKIEIECDNLEQVKEAIEVGVDIIMLDNMNLSQIKEAIKLIDNKAIIEVSGGVSIENAKDIAAAGVDIISVGKITHSANSVDIGLDIVN